MRTLTKGRGCCARRRTTHYRNSGTFDDGARPRSKLRAEADFNMLEGLDGASGIDLGGKIRGSLPPRRNER